jgi:hypothetical protein
LFLSGDAYFVRHFFPVQCSMFYTLLCSDISTLFLWYPSVLQDFFFCSFSINGLSFSTLFTFVKPWWALSLVSQPWLAIKLYQCHLLSDHQKYFMRFMP